MQEHSSKTAHEMYRECTVCQVCTCMINLHDQLVFYSSR